MRQFKAEGLRDDLFAGTPDTFFIKYLLAKAASCKDFGILVVDISVAFMHARTDEEVYVKVPSGIKSSKYWKLKAAVNGTRKASKHWQEYSSDRLVTNMLFQQNDINPCIYKRFCDVLDLEQDGDDFLMCGVTRSLEKLTEEFNRNFLVKKFEIVSLKPEHQSETHFLKRLMNHTGGTYSHDGVIDYPRFPFSEVHLGKFPGSMEFQSWKANFKTEVCSKKNRFSQLRHA